jgi:hypothetical protein
LFLKNDFLESTNLGGRWGPPHAFLEVYK